MSDSLLKLVWQYSWYWDWIRVTSDQSEARISGVGKQTEYQSFNWTSDHSDNPREYKYPRDSHHFLTSSLLTFQDTLSSKISSQRYYHDIQYSTCKALGWDPGLWSAKVPVPNSLLLPASDAPAGLVRMPDGSCVPEGRHMTYSKLLMSSHVQRWLVSVKQYEEKNARIAASQKSVYSYHHQQRSLSPGTKAALLEYEKQRDDNRRQQMRPPRELVITFIGSGAFCLRSWCLLLCLAEFWIGLGLQILRVYSSFLSHSKLWQSGLCLLARSLRTMKRSLNGSQRTIRKLLVVAYLVLWSWKDQ